MKNQKNNCNGSRGLPSGPMLAPNWQDLFVAAYRETLSITRAASAAGIARRTYYKYLQTDPDFAAKVNEAMEDAKDDLRETIFQRAKFGTPQVRKNYDSKGNLIAETTTVMHETHLAVRTAEAYLPEFKPKTSVEMSGPNSRAIAVDVTEQKRVAVTIMAQQLLDNGW